MSVYPLSSSLHASRKIKCASFLRHVSVFSLLFLACLFVLVFSRRCVFPSFSSFSPLLWVCPVVRLRSGFPPRSPSGPFGLSLRARLSRSPGSVVVGRLVVPPASASASSLWVLWHGLCCFGFFFSAFVFVPPGLFSVGLSSSRGGGVLVGHGKNSLLCCYLPATKLVYSLNSDLHKSILSGSSPLQRASPRILFLFLGRVSVFLFCFSPGLSVLASWCHPHICVA